MSQEVRSTLQPSFIHRYLKFPLLERDDRVALAERVNQLTPANVDFVMMMTLASVLASLGLMQGATAVVIGAMLVAPLMGPLLGAGLAVVQGNLKLFRDASIAIGAGVGIGLTVSLVVGLLNPGYEPSLEIEARGNPDLLDLGIAFASGMVAAYAQGRPNVASTLAGVAIAAALVPPLAVVGLALTGGYPVIAGNAGILLMTNLVAITLGAGLIFRLLGVREPRAEQEGPAWARRAVILLVMGAVLLTAPLFMNVLKEKQKGQDRPLSYPVSPAVRNAMRTFVADHPGIDVITIARSSVEPERGIGVLMTSNTEVSPSVVEEVQTLVQHARGESIPVEVHVMRSAKGEWTVRGAACGEGGICGACPLGGVTTEEQMFALFGSHYAEEPWPHRVSPDAQLMRTMIDAFAAYERALIRARTKAALAAKAAWGERTSPHALYGWSIGEDGVQLIKVPEEQRILSRILRPRGRGLSIRAIATTLNDKGLPARGKRWRATSPYPMEGTWEVLIINADLDQFPGPFPGATLELIGSTGKGFYSNEEGDWDPDLTATTSYPLGPWGGFTEVTPGEVEITWGGTAEDCILFKGWPSDKENTMRLPVMEGFITFADVTCPSQ